MPRYDSDLYVSKLSQIYAKADSGSVKKSILELLYYSRSCEGDKFVESVSQNPNESKELKKLATSIVALGPKKRKNDSALYKESREMIKASLTRISDEALYELWNCNKIVDKILSF